MTIHDRLLEERQRLGLTQTQAGQAAGVTMVTWQSWERSGRFPNADALAKLYSVGFDVLYVVTGVRNAATLENDQAQVVAQMAMMDAHERTIFSGMAELIIKSKDRMGR